MMKTKKIRKKLTVDIILLIVFIVNLVTGFIIIYELLGSRFALSKDVGTNQFQLLNITARNPSMIVHTVSGLFMISFLIYHLTLNWKTFTGYFKVLLKKTYNFFMKGIQNAYI